jgi:hypothetical protein
MVLPAIGAALALFASAPADGGRTLPRVFVETSSHAGALSSLLTEELGATAVATRRDEAELRVFVESGLETLALRIVDDAGNLALERVLDAAGGAKPALRTAVVLVRETRAVWSPRARARPSEDWHVELAPSAVTTWWAAPLTPSVGFALGARARRGAFSVGAEVTIAGQLCCTRSTSSRDVDAREVMVAATAGTTLIEAGVFDVGVELGAGVTLLSGSARGSFPSPGTPSPLSATQGVGLLAIALRADLGATSVELRAGVRATAPNVEVAEPPGSAAPEAALETGLIAPFASLGIAVEIF